MAPEAQPSGVRGSITRGTYFFAEAGRSMEYALFVPTSYRADTPAPLVILLHGLFSNPHHVIRYRGIVQEAERRGYLVAAPFGFDDRSWYGSLGRRFPQRLHPEHENAGELSERDVLNVLERVRDEHSIDDRRIFLMGHSMGGAGTLHLGAAYPELWAGLAAMSPPVVLAQDGVMTYLERLRGIPVMVLTGERDRITPVQPVRDLVSAMQAAGLEHRYCEVEGGGHAAPALRPRLAREVFDFFEGRRRCSPAPRRPELSGFEVNRELPEAAEAAAGDLSPQRAQLRRQPDRKWLSRVFTVLGHVQRHTLRAELAGWSVFYFTKHKLSSIRTLFQMPWCAA